MRNGHIERKTMSELNSSWTKNISMQFLNNKTHRIVFFLIILFSIAILVYAFSTFTNKVSTVEKKQAQQQLTKTNAQTRDMVQSKLNDTLINLSSVANAVSTFADFDDNQLRRILETESNKMNYHSMVIATTDGIGYCNDGSVINILHNDYFKNAIVGKSNVSQVEYSVKSGKPIIAFAVPIYQGKEIIGVLLSTKLVSELEKSLSFPSLNTNSYTHIIRKSGESVLRSTGFQNDANFTNIFSSFIIDNENSSVLKSDLASGKSGFQFLNDKNGESLYSVYTPLNETNDWYVLSFTPSHLILKQTDSIIRLTYGLMLLLIVIILVFTFYIFYMKRSSKKTFEFLAYTDPLTGIRCWEKFALDAQDVVKKGKDKNYAYIYSNILNFKYVNDILGFEVGNHLLQHVADVLSQNLAADEPFTRVNADRFSFFLEYTSDKSLIKRLEDINRQISSFKTMPSVSFSIKNHYGIYKIKDKALNITTMGDRALLALQTIHEAKETNYSFYTSDIREKVLFEKELENDMQTALDEKQFIIHLQPKFDLDQNSIIGAEALVRWQHPKRGLIPPMEFIKLFESNGFITKLDLYVFEETCKLLRKWIDCGKEPVPISTNLSRVHIYNPNIAEELYCTVLRYNIPPRLIEIELTESMDFDNITLLLDIISRLKRFDFTISIDDFGSGYSSLNFLKDLPVDILKIDREFFSVASDENRGRQVIASIIDMAKRLDMKTVAEGVELREQADFLTSVNCDFVQGYFFSRPICISDFEKKYVFND